MKSNKYFLLIAATCLASSSTFPRFEQLNTPNAKYGGYVLLAWGSYRALRETPRDEKGNRKDNRLISLALLACGGALASGNGQQAAVTAVDFWNKKGKSAATDALHNAENQLHLSDKTKREFSSATHHLQDAARSLQDPAKEFAKATRDAVNDVLKSSGK